MTSADSPINSRSPNTSARPANNNKQINFDSTGKIDDEGQFLYRKQARDDLVVAVGVLGDRLAMNVGGYAAGRSLRSSAAATRFLLQLALFALSSAS